MIFAIPHIKALFDDFHKKHIKLSSIAGREVSSLYHYYGSSIAKNNRFLWRSIITKRK